MSTFGRSVIGNFGKSIRLSADGRPKMKQAGVTVDWLRVAAAGAPITLNDGVDIQTGDKYLRYGQVLCAITGGEITTDTITGGAGTFTVTVGGQVTTALAFNASTAAVQAALEALSTVGAGNVVVGGSPSAYTFTFATALGNLVVTSVGAGGATATLATTSEGGSTGKYGPYDPAAADGRQTLTRGQCSLVNETVKENDLHSDHPAVLYGGMVFLSRVIQSGVAAHSLAAGPTLAELYAAFPQLQPVTES